MRLSKITTRTGDDGTTGLANGNRLPKNHVRIATLGGLDELNSHLGLLLTEAMDDAVRTVLQPVQHDLFDLGAALATPGALFPTERVLRLEAAITQFNAALPPLREFVLPGGTRAAALCHVARSVARRVERDYLSLMQQEAAPREGLQYLNRLSDLLFVLSRVLNRTAGQTETLWQPQD